VIERAREKPKAPALTSRELRRRRGRALAIRYAVGVGLPTILSVVYYGCLATPQYESEAIFALQASSDPLAAPSGKGGSKDVKVLREYILSRDLSDLLAHEQGLAEHYAQANADRWVRLPAGASLDEVHAYFLGKLRVTHDSASNVLKVRVRAFSPEKAQAFAQAIVSASEAKVRDISAKAQENLIRVAQDRLARAEASPRAPPYELERGREALEHARDEAADHDVFVAVIAEPALAHGPAYPKKLWGIATVCLGSLALVAVLSLLASAVREHAHF